MWIALSLLAVCTAIVALNTAGGRWSMGTWRFFGRSAITGLARLDGWPVAVLASDPNHYAGGWTAEASQKVTRFVETCTFVLRPDGQVGRFQHVHLAFEPSFLLQQHWLGRRAYTTGGLSPLSRA